MSRIGTKKIDKSIETLYYIKTMTLNRNYYLVHNTIAETVTHYDDAYRLVGWLLGKKTSHLVIHVIKGDRAKLLTVENDVLSFQKRLIETMNTL